MHHNLQVKVAHIVPVINSYHRYRSYRSKENKVGPGINIADMIASVVRVRNS